MINDPSLWQEELETISEELQNMGDELSGLQYDRDLSEEEKWDRVRQLGYKISEAAQTVESGKNAARFAISILKGLG